MGEHVSAVSVSAEKVGAFGDFELAVCGKGDGITCVGRVSGVGLEAVCGAVCPSAVNRHGGEGRWFAEEYVFQKVGFLFYGLFDLQHFDLEARFFDSYFQVLLVGIRSAVGAYQIGSECEQNEQSDNAEAYQTERVFE